jgi:hypothetical protein
MYTNRANERNTFFLYQPYARRKDTGMNRQQEQIANHYVVKRSSVNNGLPYRQQQVYNQDTEEYEDVWPPTMPNSALRYTTTQGAAPIIRSGNRSYVIQTSPPQQSSRTTEPQEEEAPRHRRVHWSLIFGIGMAAMLSLWILGNIALNWWNVTQDDWHYGRPRTFQVDAVVGHSDSSSSPSHFIAMNYHSQIQIIEFPGGNTSHAKIYKGLPLYGGSQDLTVVTLSFKDVNGDGKPDMIINVANTHIAYINDNGQFRPLRAGEQVTPY